VARYLSAEWFDAAQRALDGCDAPDGTSDFVVQHVVLGAPDGDIAFHVDLVAGACRIERGRADAPSITFTERWETAVAIAQGVTSAQEAFIQGRMTVNGDLAALIEHAAAMATLDAALDDLRRGTEYPLHDSG
jgi:predicted lipid carrier protein YhbT